MMIMKRRINIMEIPSHHCDICGRWHQNMTFIEGKYDKYFICRYCKKVLLNFWKDDDKDE